jgi:hypothetical protein
MSASRITLIIFLIFPVLVLHSESFRTEIEGNVEVSLERPTGSSLPVGIYGAFFINISSDTRFIRGVEIEIAAPQAWLQYRNSLVMIVYNNITPKTAIGVADIDGNRVFFEPMPNKLQIVNQIPIRRNHGLRSTAYATVGQNIAAADSFPLLFRLMPAIKGISNELERMKFNVTVRPIVSDEGAIRIVPRYPPQLANKPFTVLIDDAVVNNINEQIVLREGEHKLTILSDDYRTENRRFTVEKAKVTDLTIELQDPAPVIIFTAPQNARAFLNNSPVTMNQPITVDPGQHEARFQMGDYTVLRTLNVQRGKTYRVNLGVDLSIDETD